MDSIRRRKPSPSPIRPIIPPPSSPPIPFPILAKREESKFRVLKNHPPVSQRYSPEIRSPQRSPRKKSKIILIVFFLILSIVGGSFGYLSWEIGRAADSMNIESKQSNFVETMQGARSLLSPFLPAEKDTLPGEEEGRTNILLLGRADEGTAGQHLTDTIIIASIDFHRKEAALLSLPRDLFVEVPGAGFSTKINALYQYDIPSGKADTIRQAVENVIGLPIHAFLTVDYSAFKEAVDALGGIPLYVERDLYDDAFPGPNYSYETFAIKKGWHNLDGVTALKYVRERHSDPDGDFGRAKRQQAVLAAMRDRAFSLHTLLNPVAIGNLVSALGNHIRTDLTSGEIRRLVSLAREIDTKQIEMAVVDAWKKESLLRVSHISIGSVAMFILVPRTGNWNEIRDLAAHIFDREHLLAQRQAAATETASLTIVNASGNELIASRVKELLSLSLSPARLHTTNLSPEDHLSPRSFLFDHTNGSAPQTIDLLTTLIDIPLGELDQHPTFATSSHSDIILVLGQDLLPRLGFDEDAPESIRIITPEGERREQEVLTSLDGSKEK